VLRVVLAVLLAVALVGVAVPAVERARAERAADLAEGSLARVAERATGLAAAEEATGGGAARRTLSVSVPSGGLATGAVDYLAVGGAPNCMTPEDTASGDVVVYRLAGGAVRVRYLPVDLRVVGDGQTGDDDPLVLREDAVVTLSLVRDGDQRRVHVQRGRAPAGDTDRSDRRPALGVVGDVGA
jgi:hypothetical protein